MEPWVWVVIGVAVVLFLMLLLRSRRPEGRARRPIIVRRGRR